MAERNQRRWETFLRICRGGLAALLDERTLAERLIRYDTSQADELVAAAGFVRGWIESREIEVRQIDHNRLPVLIAEAGSRRADAPCVVLHGHLDVVPANPEQFQPRIEGDRLIGRGAYDMKGGLAAMMCALKDADAQDAVRVRFICVPDEESEDLDERSTDAIVSQGFGGDFAITGEPTDLHIGVQAKGVLVLRIVVHGRAAHSSTPWLGDNAVLKAVDVFRAIETLPFSRESTEMYRPAVDQPRPDRGRRRAQQGPGSLRDGRRRPLPSRPGSRGDPRPGPSDPGH